MMTSQSFRMASIYNDRLRGAVKRVYWIYFFILIGHSDMPPIIFHFASNNSAVPVCLVLS